MALSGKRVQRLIFIDVKKKLRLVSWHAGMVGSPNLKEDPGQQEAH